MRALLELAAAFCLIASLLAGSVAHAADTCSGGEATGAASLEAASDQHRVPAKGDRGYPHHHTLCHGHDLGAPLHGCASLAPTARAPAPRPLLSPELAAGPPGHLLRPPIA